jgi:S-DNA-T family DNA segregation ATPase FtsK/SpoIIIE
MRAEQFPSLLGDVRKNFSDEIAGIAVFLAGILALFSLRAEEGIPWLVQIAGWTAPLIGVGLLIAGAVLVLREHIPGGGLGYWSAESLIGAELVLITLAVGTFVVNNPQMDWGERADGSNGGLIGMTIGGLLTSAFGQEIALAIVVSAGILGLYTVVRFSPLLIAAVYARRAMPVVPLYWRWFLDEYPALKRYLTWGNAGTGDAAMPNFVPPQATGPAPSRAQAIPVSTKPARTVPPPLADAVAQTPAARSAKRSRRSPRATLRPASALPPLDMLNADVGEYGSVNVGALEQTIEQTLADFDVPVRVVHVESGPTVTQFGVEPLYLEKSTGRRKVRVNRIANLADDLALALAAKSVRIEAPVPGRPYVGIEVPNTVKSLVSLRGILESKAMKKPGAQLMMGLGRDTSGSPVAMDLATAPHLLIAGATGSGKSVSINAILTSLLMQHGPESLQMILVDPKMVELPSYNGIPHLIGKVITDTDQVMGALTWLLLQMDDRYRLFRAAGARNITAYNEMVRKQGKKSEVEPLPYIVLVVDELADLMMTAAEDIERQICRLAQMSRATGIHLVLATQRPSTDVVTGVIKANFPSRIAFAVTSQVDSRVILDQPGAERLLGQGDMLLMRPDAAKLFRLQGCYVSDQEIDSVVAYWRNQEGSAPAVVPPWNGLMDRMDHEDELVLDAVDLLRGMKTCSTSMLQRKLRLGYPKAARLMEQLEAEGIVGPDMGGGQGREVLIEDDEDGEEVDDLF